MKRLVGALLLSVLLCASVSAELKIEITRGVDNPIPVAIVPFAWDGDGFLSEDIAGIIAADLEQVGEFIPLSRSNMLSLPKDESEVYYRDWRILAQDYLLTGMITRSPGSQLLQVQYELFDINREQRLVGEVFTGGLTQLRDIAHEISDVIYQQITGNPGAFTTQILYVSAEYISPELTYYRLERSDYDGQRSEVLLEREQPIMSPAWSPDGEEVAYVSFETTLPRIYIQNIVTGQRRMLEGFRNMNSSPVFSPDGTKLALVLSKDGSPDLYIKDLITNSLTQLTSHPRVEIEPSWTADGKFIVFTSDRTGQPQIYQIEVETGLEERLTFDCYYCAKGKFLPDGSNLVHVRRATREASYSIAIYNVDTGRVITLTETTLDESPSIAPNGSMIMFATKYNGKGILDVVSIDGRVKFRLPSTQGDVREPSWSPYFN